MVSFKTHIVTIMLFQVLVNRCHETIVLFSRFLMPRLGQVLFFITLNLYSGSSKILLVCTVVVSLLVFLLLL